MEIITTCYSAELSPLRLPGGKRGLIWKSLSELKTLPNQFQGAGPACSSLAPPATESCSQRRALGGRGGSPAMLFLIPAWIRTPLKILLIFLTKPGWKWPCFYEKVCFWQLGLSRLPKRFSRRLWRSAAHSSGSDLDSNTVVFHVSWQCLSRLWQGWKLRLQWWDVEEWHAGTLVIEPAQFNLPGSTDKVAAYYGKVVQIPTFPRCKTC